MELLWLIPLLVVVSFVQNMAFTWTSRSRNSGDPSYHRFAAWSSNGVWFLAQMTVVKIMWEPLMAGEFWKVAIGGVFYVLSTTEGSVFMMKLLLGHLNDKYPKMSAFFMEKGKREVGKR